MNETSTAISFLDQLIVRLLKRALGRVNSQLRTMVAESKSVLGASVTNRIEETRTMNTIIEIGMRSRAEWLESHYLTIFEPFSNRFLTSLCYTLGRVIMPCILCISACHARQLFR